METEHKPHTSAESLSSEDKELFDAAEQDILDQHRRELGARMTHAVQRVYEATRDNGEVGVADFFDLGDLLDEDTAAEEGEPSEEAAPEADINERRLKAEEAMREVIQEGFLDSAKSYHSLKRARVSDELMLRIAIEQAKEADPRKVSTRSKVTDSLRQRIEASDEKLEELAEQSPESHVVVHGYEFRELVRQIADGEIARTPYVDKHLSRVEANMTSGVPTFIHGHLGSGKTELAIAAAKHSSISRAAYSEAKDDFKAFREANPEATKEECREALGRAYRRRTREHERALRAGDSAAVEKFAPLIISGSKDLTSQDMFADKTLKLTHFNGKPLLEHVKDIDDLVAEWQEKNPEDAKDPVKLQDAANKILEVFKMQNQAFGTEVETIRKEILQGAQDGRPVIIDEANAIPSAILISLNDLLQRKPGDTCHIPGVGPVKIKEGFSLTLTGNLSTGPINYAGTNDLNPAFLSRLDMIEHDYLPMSDIDPGYKEANDPQKNELFRVVVAYLADKHGDLSLPEMDKSLSKLFRLSQLAHQTQIVFEGKANESNMLRTASGDEMEPSLEQSVLSIRNMLNVLRKWDKGSEMDIDTALWEGFISSIPNPDDQNSVIAMALQYGFFSESEGWQAKVKERGSGFTSFDEIHPGKLTHERKELETYDLREVVDMLYGPRPERKIYPEINLDELEEEIDDEPTLEEIETYEKKLDELTNAIAALEVLYDQCGCNVSQGE